MIGSDKLYFTCVLNEASGRGGGCGVPTCHALNSFCRQPSVIVKSSNQSTCGQSMQQIQTIIDMVALIIPLLTRSQQRIGWTPQQGLSSNKMALITSDCGTMRSLGIKWP